MDFSLRFRQAKVFHQAHKRSFLLDRERPVCLRPKSRRAAAVGLRHAPAGAVFSLAREKKMGGSKRTSHCKWQMKHPRQRRNHPNVGIGKKEPPGGTPGSSFKSDRSGNFSGAHATRTDINMTGRTVDNRLDAFYIGLPGTVGTPVRVRDLNTKGHAFAAILALSHPLHLPAVT